MKFIRLALVLTCIQAPATRLMAQDSAADIDAKAYKLIVPIEDRNYSISVQEGEVASLEKRFRDLREARSTAGLHGRINLIYYVPYSEPAEHKQKEIARLVAAADRAGLQLDIDVEQLPNLKGSLEKLYEDARYSTKELFSRLRSNLNNPESLHNVQKLEESIEEYNLRRFRNLNRWQAAANTSTARLFSLIIPPVKIGLGWTLVYMKAGIHPSTLALMAAEALVQGTHGYYGAQAARFKEKWPYKVFGEKRLARFFDAGKFLNLAFFNFTVFSIGYSSFTNVMYYNAGVTNTYLTPEFWANTALIGGLSAVIGTAGARGLYMLQQKSRLSAPIHNYVLWSFGLLAQVNGFLVASGAPSSLTWTVVALGSWLPQALLYSAGRTARIDRQRMLALSPRITAEQRQVIDKYEDSASTLNADKITPEELAEQLARLNKKTKSEGKLWKSYQDFVRQSLDFARNTCFHLKNLLGY